MTIDEMLPKETLKPWGKEILYVKTKDYVLKKLCITKYNRFSLQYHEQKEESWYFLKGKVFVILGDNYLIADPGMVLHVPPRTIHRLEALSEDAEILEASTPYLDDVVRLHDDHKRI